MHFLFDAFFSAPTLPADVEPITGATRVPVAAPREPREALFGSFWPQSAGSVKSPEDSGNFLPAIGNDLPVHHLPDEGDALATAHPLPFDPPLFRDFRPGAGATALAAALRDAPTPNGAVALISSHAPGHHESDASAPPPTIPATHEPEPLTRLRPESISTDESTSVTRQPGSPGVRSFPVPSNHEPVVRTTRDQIDVDAAGELKQDRPAADAVVRPGRPVSGIVSGESARNLSEGQPVHAVGEGAESEPPMRPGSEDKGTGVQRLMPRLPARGALLVTDPGRGEDRGVVPPSAQNRLNAVHLSGIKINIKQYITTVTHNLDEVPTSSHKTPAGASAAPILADDYHRRRTVSSALGTRPGDEVAPSVLPRAAAADRPAAVRDPGVVINPAATRPTEAAQLAGLAQETQRRSAEGLSEPSLRGISAKVSATVPEHSATLSAVIEPMNAARAQPSLLETPISLDVVDKRWSQAVGDRLLVMVDKIIGKAQIRLNPAHLGPVKVEIDTVRGGSSVEFVAASPITREALESALPRLREMFEQQGLSLSGASVRDEQGRQTESHDDRRDGQRAGEDWSRRAEADSSAERRPSVAPDSDALVDTYV